MNKYLYRTCPKCYDYLGIVVRDPPEPKREIPIDAYCVLCGFKVGWKVLQGSQQLLDSGNQLLRSEWLRNIIVTAALMILFLLFKGFPFGRS